MPSFFENKDRKIIPRWRSFRTTAALGELASSPANSGVAAIPSGLKRRIEEWNEKKTIWHATDLVGSAVAIGQEEEALGAARYILHSGKKASLLSKGLASQIVNPRSKESPDLFPSEYATQTLNKAIRDLKYRLRVYPHDAIAWVDLALAYTVSGRNEKAERAIRTALALAGSNRFVLRSAARFFIHTGDVEYAFELLRSGEFTPYDPWLLASVIAVGSAAGISPRSIKRAVRMLGDLSNSPWQLTELASAVATVELENGHHIAAKRLFRNALVSPTENSVAQAEWAKDHLSGLAVHIDDLNPPRVFEARAIHNFSEGQWESAKRESVNWYEDEPFSSRPAILRSYISSMVYEDYAETIDMLEKSLITNPKHVTLLNNLAYCYACFGQIGEADRVLAQINPRSLSGSSQIAVLATNGLVCFRRGLVDQGRNFYRAAIEKASQSPAFAKLRAIASILLAREEVVAKSPRQDEAVKTALRESRDRKEPDLLVQVERLKSLLGHAPSQAAQG